MVVADWVGVLSGLDEESDVIVQWLERRREANILKTVLHPLEQ